MSGELRVFETVEALSCAAAELFAVRAAAAAAHSDRLLVALAGGSTPKRLYQVLAQPPDRDRIDWGKVEFFWGDERAVPAQHPDSNFAMANEVLLLPLGIPSRRIHRMPADCTDLDAAARDYQGEIARVAGVSIDDPPPSFDLILLGMGADGHTASLFPHSPALLERQRWVVPNPGPDGRGMRLTLTLALINRAKLVVFLVAGAEKAVVLAKVWSGNRGEPFPAQLVAPRGELLWLVDRAASEGVEAGSEAVEQ